MAAVSAKRRAELEAKLDRLARAREALMAALGAREEQLGGTGAGVGAVSDAEWKAKYEGVKGKLAQFKVMKKVRVAVAWGGSEGGWGGMRTE